MICGLGVLTPLVQNHGCRNVLSISNIISSHSEPRRRRHDHRPLYDLLPTRPSRRCSTDGIQWFPPLRYLTALKEEHAPTWVAQLPYRGTWGILYSCTFTLGLCVYTEIHLNIPARDDTVIIIWLRKLKWMFIALIVPEIVLYTAWAQRYEARRICHELNELVRKIAQ